jgi:phosphatidylserine decarboxylase
VELFPFNYARGTPRWLAVFPLLTIICGFLYWLIHPTIWFIIGGFAALFIMLPLSLFFRDPERRIGEGVVSPADGRIVAVEHRRSNWVFVSIFMNIHNVHVNRMPWDGVILDMKHISGGYAPAFNKESDSNERMITKFRTTNGTWEITQIAGAMARRIVPYAKIGNVMVKGQRFGMIKFGSRVDLLFKLPRGMVVNVEVDQRVLAGSTSIAIPSRKVRSKHGRDRTW